MDKVINLVGYGACKVLPVSVVKDDLQYQYEDSACDVLTGAYWDVVSDDDGNYYATHIC